MLKENQKKSHAARSGSVFTYVHVDKLAISFTARHNGCHNHKLAVRHEVADASFSLGRRSRNIEFQSRGQSEEQS